MSQNVKNSAIICFVFDSLSYVFIQSQDFICWAMRAIKVKYT